MLNSGSSNLDEILVAERMNKEHNGLGYSSYGKTVTTQIVFVKASTSGVKNDEDMCDIRIIYTHI